MSSDIYNTKTEDLLELILENVACLNNTNFNYLKARLWCDMVSQFICEGREVGRAISIADTVLSEFEKRHAQ